MRFSASTETSRNVAPALCLDRRADDGARSIVAVEAALLHSTADRGVEGAVALVRERECEAHTLDERIADGHGVPDAAAELRDFARRVESVAGRLDVTKPSDGAIDPDAAVVAPGRLGSVANDLDRDDGAHD